MDSEKRKSTQFLVPDHISETPKGTYDIYPGFSVAENAIQTGYTGLADFIEIHKTVMIDGYVGVFWDDLRQGLDREFKARGIDVLWHDVSHALKDSDVIDGLIEPYLGGDDPLFGKRAVLDLDDFFNTEGLVSLARDPSVNINILFGTGAGLCAWEVPLVYVDVPKNEIQFRMRAGSITNLGAKKAGPHKSMYKRFYFVDWVILNRHKQQLVSKIDVLVDDQRPKKPFWTTGECLRNSLVQMSENVFRVRPWFEPGPWGGTWIKENIDGLSKDVPNYAWSFELIVPENGLLLEDQGKVLEFSFDFLMFQEYKNVLGEAADFFGYEFPIRFDYLDTFDGGNLSIQVHPKQEYFVREFGEGFTQDECYYILDTKENADVYLGFREGVDGQRFREALERSARKATPLNMDNYVQAIKAKKHDLFLIPGGTVHGSGKNNLVLEISATPYIFTFKLYDWLRLDLEGNPRPLNLERGFANLDFDKKGDVIAKEHIATPKLFRQGKDWNLFQLPTHKDHFYDIHRYEFDTMIKISNNDQCHVLTLVEGTSLLLETKRGMRQRFNFGETFVVPAACGTYTLTNENKTTCKVLKAFVKSEKVKSSMMAKVTTEQHIDPNSKNL